MSEVICLDDSDDDTAAPVAPPSARPSTSRPVQPPSRPHVRSETNDSSDGLGSSDPSSGDEGIFTERTARQRVTKKRRVVVARDRRADDTAPSPVSSVPNASETPHSSNVRASRGTSKAASRSGTAAASDSRAASREAQKAAQVRDAEETRRRAASERARARQQKEREKVMRQNEKHRASVVGGKYKLRQITAVMSVALSRDAFGASLRDEFNMGVKDDGNRGVVPLLHTVEDLPLERSITWRYHAPSTAPAPACEGAADALRPSRFPFTDGASEDGWREIPTVSAKYTLLYMTGEAFAAACFADHAAGVRGLGRGETFPDELPESGLEALLVRAKREVPGHALGLLLEGVRKSCEARERREFRSGQSGARGFSRAVVENALARLVVEDEDVRVTSVPDRAASVRHVAAVTVALAKKPYERDLGVLDILAHAKGASITPAGRLALETSVAVGSSVGAVGSDGAGAVAGASAGGSVSSPTADRVERQSLGKTKTSAETWCRALMTVDGCAEASALAIVRAFPSMSILMHRYRCAALSEREKKELLKDLVRAPPGGTAASENRKVGPVVSARVYSILKPRDPRDAGDEIVGVGVMER